MELHQGSAGTLTGTTIKASVLIVQNSMNRETTVRSVSNATRTMIMIVR